MKKAIIICLSASIIFTGCGAMAGEESSDTSNGIPISDIKSTDTNTRIASYNGRDRDKVKKHLEQYPTDFDALKETEVCLNIISVTMRKEKLNEFIECVQRGETASVDIITFTIEGDAVPVYIQYNGNNFYCYESFANDSYAAKNAKQFKETKYKNMYLLDIPNEEFSDIDFSGMDTGFQQFVLSNEEIDDYSSFERSEKDSYSIRISPFDSEEAAKENISSAAP